MRKQKKPIKFTEKQLHCHREVLKFASCAVVHLCSSVVVVFSLPPARAAQDSSLVMRPLAHEFACRPVIYQDLLSNMSGLLVLPLDRWPKRLVIVYYHIWRHKNTHIQMCVQVTCDFSWAQTLTLIYHNLLNSIRKISLCSVTGRSDITVTYRDLCYLGDQINRIWFFLILYKNRTKTYLTLMTITNSKITGWVHKDIMTEGMTHLLDHTVFCSLLH